MSSSNLNNNLLEMIKSITIPLLIGLLASLFTRSSMKLFSTINMPPLSPPAILFPIVWTVLYTLMGISAYVIVNSNEDKEIIRKAIKIYTVQLIVNFLWPTFFFNFRWYLFSFIWLLFLWILVVVMIKKFSTISKTAAWINVPYLVWLTYAAYLNLGIFLLN